MVITSSPILETDTYGHTETIRFTVTFDTPVAVDTTGGTPRLRFRLANAGGTTPANKNLDYVSGSGTAVLIFEYVVQLGDMDTSGISVGSNWLQANGGAIKHATTGRDARLNHAALGNFPGHKVDGSSKPVPSNWSLIPSGLAVGDSFRLLFLSSTTRNARSNDITDYNTFIQNRAAAGHADIQAYSSSFKVVGCTASDDARDNTGTTYTSTDKGVRIYWLNGAKVDDDDEDFYDGTWDDEANDKNESGTNGPDTSDEATEEFFAALSKALGSNFEVAVGRPNSSGSGHGPLTADVFIISTNTRPFYGLSEAFRVAVPSVARVTVSKSALTVTEQDATGDTYSMVLDTQPTANVTVTITGHPGTDVTLTPSLATLTFTTMNWDTAQTVTVKAGNDADTVNDSVTLTHTATSTDSDYDGITIAAVRVTVEDNDTEQVTGVTLTPDNAQLVVNWSAVYNATGYRVQWKSGGEDYNTGDRQYTVDSGSTTTYTIGSLANGTEYTVRVIATRTGYNDGTPSDEKKGTPTAPNLLPGAPPPDLMATASGQNQINLSWTAPSHIGNSPITGYKIQYSDDGISGWTNLDNNTDNTDVIYSDIGLSAGTTRYYQVFAINSNGTGPASNVADATTIATDAPGRVTGVKITPGYGALTVGWTVVSGATGYKVQWKSGVQNYNTGDRQFTVTSGSTASHTISNLNNGTEYTVRVLATKTGASDGQPSVEKTGTPVSSLPTVSFGSSSYTASESGATARVIVELSVPASVTIPLRIHHQGGATSADYSGVPSRLIFTSGETSRIFTVTAVDDLDNDDGERLRIEFGNLPAGVEVGARSTVTVRLDDNDGGNSPPAFTSGNEIRILDENAAPNQDVGLPVTAADADNDVLNYAIDGLHKDRFTVVSTNGQIRTKAGQTYDYETDQTLLVKVVANDGNGGTATATVVIRIRDVDEPPMAPTGLMLVQAHPTSMALSWTSPDNTGRPAITGYDLQYKKTNESTWPAGPQGVTTTSDSLTGLAASTTYQIQVRAKNDEGIGAWSTPLTRSTPRMTRGISISRTTLTVTEGDQTGETYVISLGSQPTADVRVFISGFVGTRVRPNTQSQTFTTVNWNTPKTVTVKANEDADATNETVTLTHRSESTDANYNDITVPDMTVIDNDTAQVTGVWTQPGDSHLVVNWTAADNATGYRVQWKTAGQVYNTYGRVATITSGSTTSYTIPNLTNGTEYTVQVTATRTDASDGPPSAAVTGTPTAIP